MLVVEKNIVRSLSCKDDNLEVEMFTQDAGTKNQITEFIIADNCSDKVSLRIHGAWELQSLFEIMLALKDKYYETL